MGNSRKPTSAPSPSEAADLDLMSACVEMLRRTGATGIQVRYSDDEQPVVWMVLAEYSGRHEAAAALTAGRAAMRLLELLVDGGQCQHCRRPTAITRDFEPQLLSELVCWYQFDPELKCFRRGCS